MNEVIEPLMINEPIHEVPVAGRSPATKFLDARFAGSPIARRPRVSWSSSLSDPDLQCLLRVIEAELIPQLISGYSPARCSPPDLSP